MNQSVKPKLTYGQLITILYGENFQRIIDVINKSVYVESYDLSENTIHLHTGFSFESHKGKEFELIFNMDSKQLIRQVRADFIQNIPQINGLYVTKHRKKYFNAFYNKWLRQINSDDENMKTIQVESIKREDFDDVAIKNGNNEYTEVKIVLENETVMHFPLRKVLNRKLFYNGSVFKEDIPDREYYASGDDYYQDDDDYHRERYGQYEGTWAQDVEGLSDDFINDVLDGDPDAYWNID